MKKLKLMLLILLLVPTIACATDRIGVLVRVGGLTKAQEDLTANAFKVLLNDSMTIAWTNLPQVQDVPAQKYYYVVWADQRAIATFTNATVPQLAANWQAWLDSQGPLKNFFVLLMATNGQDFLSVEYDAGFTRMTNQ